MNLNLILLAAGNSRRFGSNKLLHCINGIPMYQQMLNTIEKAEEDTPLFKHKIVVTKYEEISQVISYMEGYTVVENKQSELGISTSVRLGVETSLNIAKMERSDIDGWCFLVCDQPYLTSKTLKNFVISWWESDKALGCVSYQKRIGNPTIFARKFEGELLGLTGDVGGKEIMKKHIEEVICFPVLDERELEDIDY
ncbi:nucleotidyltransferase family protein [Lachnospiraceae bacterium LCP25S3_G4]